MRRREALEAYRRSRAGAQQASSQAPLVTASAPAPAPKPVKARVSDPEAHAVQNYERWISGNHASELIEHYPFLPMPPQRQKVLNWAVEKARAGDLHPLLAIGMDDTDPAVQKHLNRIVETIPADLLLAKAVEGRFTVKERRSVAGLLGRCKAPQAGKLLARLARHEDARVRESAVQALAHFPATDGLQLPIFKRLLEEDPHPDVRLRAAEGLVKLGTPEAVGLLEKAAKKDTATPEIQAVLNVYQARRRPKSAVDFGFPPEPKKERKQIPKDVMVKLVAILIMFGVAGIMAKKPVQQWYEKRQARAAAIAAAQAQQ